MGWRRLRTGLKIGIVPVRYTLMEEWIDLSRYLRPSFLVFAALMAVVIVACGGAAAPSEPSDATTAPSAAEQLAPTVTPIP